MTIQFNGYGMFEIEEKNFKRFMEICEIDNVDLFLDMLNMHNNIGAVPIISINVEKIENEGPIPYSHHKTEHGVTRMNQLIEEILIKPV